jgi:hypothetical protein
MQIPATLLLVLKLPAHTTEITIGGSHYGGTMAGKLETDINLEEVADKLAAATDASTDGDKASAGTTDAVEARSVKKKARKRVAKKKTAKKKTKKTRKKKAKTKKKERAKAVPKKRARAKKAKPVDAPVEVEPSPEPPVEETPAAPEAAISSELGEASEEKAADNLNENQVECSVSEPVESLPATPVDSSSKEPVECALEDTVECLAEDSAELTPDEPVELSPEEALELLTGLGDATGSTGTGAAPAIVEAEDTPVAADIVQVHEDPHCEQASSDEPGILASILGASCRVLTFEGEGVDEEMCVARAAVERLQLMAIQCGLEVSIGPICRTPAEFLAEWDNTPPSMPVTIIANLSCAGAFLPAVVEERPRVASAYWIVFETLRGVVSTATSAFLSELRSRHRLRAFGFGPRNVMEAARGGAEAVRGHVEWGFGQGPVSVAG